MPLLPDAKLQIEAAFAAYIQPVFPNVVRASDREVEVDTPYAMCWAEDCGPRVRGHFAVRMQVVLVTNIDDTTTAQRAEMAKTLFNRLIDPVQFSYDGVKVFGWSRPTPKEASTGQNAGDSLVFTAGVEVGESS